MVQRPWVTPDEVRAYTEYPAVQNRADEKLKVDISRAEQYVISYTNNRFDAEDLDEIPQAVKTAVILIAEAYAYNATISASDKKSETFDDYSYTLADTSPIDIPALDIAALLDDYAIAEARNGVTLRMRKEVRYEH